jgi:hypothetical protein
LFTVPGVPAASPTLTVTRTGSSGYGSYTVVFTQDGYDAAKSTIQESPDISPLGL